MTLYKGMAYKGMDAATLEAQYNLVARKGADFPELVNRWITRSETHREKTKAKTDLPYGEEMRDKLDLYSGGDVNGPLVIYIHGGYWQRGDKSIYGFITEAFIKHGVSVAVLNYNLTPAVRIGQIPAQIRKAVSWSWHNALELRFSREKIFIIGHSAGGHLCAMMMATNWPTFDKTLPADLIRGGLPVSGLFELEPLVHTSLNQGPQMSIEEAVEQSPIFIPPVTNAPQLVVVGGGETSEFLRQSDDYAAKFKTPERSIERFNVPDMDHFDELEKLTEDDSVLFEKAMQLILG